MTQNQFIKSLNTKQYQAVTAPRIPILMLAGPGTGKTRTLIARIMFSIERHHISPEQVLALTFSNKAANEIKQRLYREMPEKAEKVRSGTFHSICIGILRKYPDLVGLKQHFSVCDENYQIKLLSSLMNERNQIKAHSKARGVLLAFSNHLLKDRPLPAYSARLFTAYNQYLNTHGLIDFNQILTKTLDLFNKNPDVLDQYRFMNEAILVDEFQDTDPIQYEILRLLAEKHRNIFVVADDDQSIYAWRGAQPENIRKYMSDFLIDDPIFLDVNYRSGQSILDAAQQIVKDTERIEPEKKVFADPEKESNIQAVFFNDERKEQKFILRKIKDWQHTRTTSLEEIAIIYPRHTFAEKIIPGLLQNKIPFQQASGKNLIEQPAMKTILLYLKMIHDPSDILILEELVQNELGYHIFKQIQDIQRIKKASFRKALNELSMRDEVSYQVRNQVATFIGNIANLVNLKSFFTFDGLIKEIIKSIQTLKSGYLEHNASKLRSTSFKQSERLKKQTTKIWIYHSDPKLLFIGIELLEQFFPSRVYKLDKEKIIHVAKNDFVLLLEPLPTNDLPCPYELIFKETTERRRGVMATLFRWLQVQLGHEGNLFRDYVVFDLETTGKNPETCGIVEIAAVRVRDSEITEEYQTLVNPGIPVEPEAQAVHQISNEDIAKAPTLETVWPQFAAFVGQDVLIAHNGYGFDFKIIDRVCKEMEMPKLAGVRYDSLILSRNLYRGKQNSIDALAERFKLDTGTRHRALDDVLVLHHIFQRLLRVKQQREIRTSGSEFTEFVALASIIENTFSATEDKILFMAGVPKLQSPYSAIRNKYTREFGLNEDDFLSNIQRIADRMNPAGSVHGAEAEFFSRVLTTAHEFNPLPVDQAIAEYLSYLALINPQDGLEKIDAVSLLTFHAAKGLEFEKVIIMGMEDNNMPNFFSRQSDDQDDRSVEKKMDEQKRLLYVGITRSKDEVIFTVVKNRDGRRQTASPFLNEIKNQIDVRETN